MGSSGSDVDGQALVSTGSNGTTEWRSVIARLSADGNPVNGPFVNLAAGSNITITRDAGPLNSVPSNTIRIHATGGAASFGSNATRVSKNSSVGASTNSAREDHIHDGIGTVTASSSNTMGRGTLNLRPGSGIALNPTDTDGDGLFDTLTIENTRAAGSGGGGGSTPTGARYPEQIGSGSSANSSTRGITMPATPTNGNTLILVSVNESTFAISSVAQTNVTWTLLATSAAGVAPVIEIWKGVVGASASTSITVTYGGSAFCNAVVSEWTGLTGTLDTSATTHATTDPTGTHPIPILTPTVATALVISGVSTTNNSATFSAFSGAYMALLVNTTIGAYFGFPGTNVVYGYATGGSSATRTGLTVSIT